jgi:glycosyltransferase involved in cell wall biosynthesis
VVPAAPFISVIIPCANQGHLLGDAIASVWRSSRRDVEIIVIDDGSADDTAIVGRSFGGVRCISQPRLGRAHARNRGLRESRGQAIVFLDADGRLAPGALDIGAAELDAHPMAAFVFGRSRAEGERSDRTDSTRTGRERQYYRELLTGNVIGDISTVMFRRDALERAGGFDPSVDAATEYGLYLRIARTNRIHDHGQVIAYSAGPRGYSRRSVAATLQDTLTVLRRERPMIENDQSLLDAYAQGWRRTRDHYGAELAREVQARMLAKDWAGVLKRTLQLGWLHPRAIGLHAARTVGTALAAVAPARRTSINS